MNNNFPLIGFGTGRIPRKEIKKILTITLNNNYILFDTGDCYNNEDLIGECIQNFYYNKNCINKKNEIKIITKYFGGKGFGCNNDLTKSFFKSLKNLKKNFIDIYLIHMPGACEFKKNEGWVFIYDEKTNYNLRIKSYKELLILKKKNLVKYIGVSNWSLKQIKEIQDIGLELPDFIEIEWCPCYRNFEIYNFCKKNNINIIGYGNIKRILNFNKYKGSIEDFNYNKNTLFKIAEKYNKTIPDIVLTWCKQLNIITIPSSTNSEHIINNINNFCNNNSFILNNDEMELINNFKQVIKGHSLHKIIS